VVAGVGAVVAAGILVIAAIHDQPKPAAPTARQTVTVTMTACVYGPHGEADRKCTYGAINPLVTQDNLGSTICAKGWTAKQRPSTSVTNRIRDGQLIRYYGSAAPAASAVREDHLISLELGGAPRDPANLYPQRYADSIEKDREEDCPAMAHRRARGDSDYLPRAAPAPEHVPPRDRGRDSHPA
jgi:hypothetical protein